MSFESLTVEGDLVRRVMWKLTSSETKEQFCERRSCAARMGGNICSSVSSSTFLFMFLCVHLPLYLYFAIFSYLHLPIYLHYVSVCLYVFPVICIDCR